MSRARRKLVSRRVRADASALVWHPRALDTLHETAELLGVSDLESISMWLTFIEQHPEVRA